MEYAPRDPDHTVVFADLDTELDGLRSAFKRAFSGKVKNMAALVPFRPSFPCSLYVRGLACNSVARCPD